MPILNTSKDGISRIYNVEVRLKSAVKVKKDTNLKGFEEADVIVNGSSFKNSIFNTKNQENNVVVNFIRNKNYRSDKKDFLVTTRKHSNSSLYDLYSIEVPPRKVTTGLDNLYGKVIVDMQKEIPDIERGRYLSLDDIGVGEHLNAERLAKLKYISETANNDKEFEYLILSNSMGDLKSTIDFIRLFEFEVIGESTVLENQVTDLINSLEKTKTREFRNLNSYYDMAKKNKSVYKKLSKLNQILYGKPINLIQKREKGKVYVKTTDTIGRKNEQKST